jgi:predicted ribosome quality control (RQC) complex YloA/Tae2 family protein
MKMNQFSYQSEQLTSEFKNGKGQTRRNSVSIQKGKGVKAVEIYTHDGTLKTRKEKQLTKTELECIQKNKFIPGLFKDCVKPANIVRPASKTRRRKQK